MGEIQTYKDLRVYQLSLEYLDKIYTLAYKIPHLKLRTQLINSAEAIAPIIAEGFAKKRNPREAARFYEMAMAESDEVCVHLIKAIILSKRFKKIPAIECELMEKNYQALAKQLNKLSVIWRNFSAKRPPDQKSDDQQTDKPSDREPTTET